MYQRYLLIIAELQHRKSNIRRERTVGKKLSKTRPFLRQKKWSNRKTMSTYKRHWAPFPMVTLDLFLQMSIPGKWKQGYGLAFCKAGNWRTCTKYNQKWVQQWESEWGESISVWAELKGLFWLPRTWSSIQRTGQVNPGAKTPHRISKPGTGKENSTKAFETSKWTLQTEITQDLSVYVQSTYPIFDQTRIFSMN